MSEVTRSRTYFQLRVGSFVLKFEKVLEEGGIELLKRWLETIVPSTEAKEQP